jgi:hypothetical protein
MNTMLQVYVNSAFSTALLLFFLEYLFRYLKVLKESINFVINDIFSTLKCKIYNAATLINNTILINQMN